MTRYVFKMFDKDGNVIDHMIIESSCLYDLEDLQNIFRIHYEAVGFVSGIVHSYEITMEDSISNL